MAKTLPRARSGGKKPSAGSRPRIDRVARKAKYLRAAASVFLREGAGASMQDVSDEAGAPKPVFYRIFPSRSDLIDAIFQHVHDAIVETQKGEWSGYGWALKALYREAKNDPEIFIVALKTFHGDPAWDPWRERLLELIHTQAELFFRPSEGAPPGGDKRAVLAARTLDSTMLEILVAWLEDRDGLADEARFVWWGRIIKEWRWATREAFALDAPASAPAPKRKR
jgi:AcrR family transcriptional regulator